MDATEERDAIAERLAAFAEDLRSSLSESAQVEHEEIFGGVVRVTPDREDALGVVWIDLGDGLQVETVGGLGGRWELDRSDADVDFVEDVVRSVVAGRVTEVRVANRSRVTVTLANGTLAVETGVDGLSGCLPIPFWPRWGRRIEYAPYSG